MSGLIPSAIFLGLLAVIALRLTVVRAWSGADRREAGRAGRVATAAVIVQAAHFTEELATGFHVRFPALFGQGPIPVEYFCAFNLAWLAIWGISVWALCQRQRLALFPLWFLSVAGLANGVAHPLLAVIVGGYFPGLISSPVIGLLGLLLLRALGRITRPIGR